MPSCSSASCASCAPGRCRRPRTSGRVPRFINASRHTSRTRSTAAPPRHRTRARCRSCIGSREPSTATRFAICSRSRTCPPSSTTSCCYRPTTRAAASTTSPSCCSSRRRSWSATSRPRARSAGSRSATPSCPSWSTFTRCRCTCRRTMPSAGLPLGTRGGLATDSYFPLDAEYSFKVQLERAPREQHELEITVDGARVAAATVGLRRTRRPGAARARVPRPRRRRAASRRRDVRRAHGGVRRAYGAPAAPRPRHVAGHRDRDDQRAVCGHGTRRDAEPRPAARLPAAKPRRGSRRARARS